MTSNYVRGASLTCAALQAEVRDMLAGAGATDVRVGPGLGASVAFVHGDRRFRLAARAARRAPEHGSAQEAARQRWRQLSLLIRAKLDAVGSGIVTFDQEFLGAMVMPGGGSVYDAAAPGIAGAYRQAGGAEEG